MTNYADSAVELLGRMFPDGRRPLAGTDPEFVQFFSTFAFGEVPAALDLDDRTRALGWLSTLLGCGGVDDFRMMLPGCLNLGLTPVEVKEIVYQANAYLGIGRVLPFLRATNEVFARLCHERRPALSQGQRVAFRQLLRRLLHPRQPGPEGARARHLLRHCGAGWLRPAAQGTRRRQPGHRQQRRAAVHARAVQPAVHRLPALAQRDCRHQRRAAQGRVASRHSSETRSAAPFRTSGGAPLQNETRGRRLCLIGHA